MLVALLLALGVTVTLIAVGPTGSAQAVPTCGYPADNCACPTLAVSKTTPEVGEAITVTGEHFSKRSKVGLIVVPMSGSGPSYRLGSARTNGRGVFSTRAVMPAATTNKGHFLINATSGFSTTAACPVDPSVEFVLAAAGNNENRTFSRPSPNSNEQVTAFTGFNILWFALLAAALVIVGFYINRRGKTPEIRSMRR